MPNVDISVIGDKALERKLGKLLVKTQKKIARKAIRESAKRTQKRVIENIERLDLVDSGVMLDAFKRTKIRSASSSPRKLIRIGPVWPTREELGIRADDKYYYPMAVEAGHPGAQAHPFVRPAVDEHQESEKRQIGRDIGKGIEAEARK